MCICMGSKGPREQLPAVGGDSALEGKSGGKWPRNFGLYSIYSHLKFFTGFCNLREKN